MAHDAALETADALALALIHSLQPADVAIDPPHHALRTALELRGVRVVADGKSDLALCLDPPATHAAALLARHGAARLLLSLDLEQLPGWLDQAASHGIVPVLSYDASWLGPAAVLLTPGPLGADALGAACVAMVQARAASAAQLKVLEEASNRQLQGRLRAEAICAQLQDRLLLADTELAAVRAERDALRSSTIWRLTAPLRALLDKLPRRRPRRPDVPPLIRAPGVPSAPQVSPYQNWIARYDSLVPPDRAAIRAHIADLPARPVISVVMPVYGVPEPMLREAILSVQAQLYPDWELCIADDASPSPHVVQVLQEMAATDDRIRWVSCPVNGNISAATNAALNLATGDFIALMDHDDCLPEHALYEIAAELALHPDTDMIYSDEDQIDDTGARTQPYFKPDWNMELMLGHNMVSHLGVYRRSLVERLGGMRLGLEGSQDYDLALRVAAATTPERIRHIPAVLYHWRQHKTSFSQSRIDACVAAARQAIADYLETTGQQPATVGASPWIETWTRVQWALPDPAPRVSVIVPTRDHAELLAQCADGLLHRTDYPDLELIIVDNGSVESQTAALFAKLAQDRRVRILDFPGPFNYSAMNNAAAAIATGEILALVNNDVDVIEPDWLTEMVSQACRPGIGAVGARLLYTDGRVQHTGVVLGVGSFDGGPGVAGHFSLAEARESYGHFGASVLVHEVSAVTAACMVLRRAVYQQVGGLDEAHLPVAFNDVDFCLRLREAGLRNIFTPHAELHHHESASRGNDLAPEHRARFDAECRYMRDRWGPLLDRDPFYNPNFSRIDGLFRLLGAPRRRAPWL